MLAYGEMMIIWGSKGREKVVGQGQFFCPRCNGTRPFLHKRIAKYFTLYFIPLFETSTLGEYIECQSCFSPFRTEILQHTKSLQEQNQMKQEVNKLIHAISDDMEAGIPIQTIASAIKNSGGDTDAVSAAIYAATEGKIKICESCGLAFKATLVFCSRCGKRLIEKSMP
jgi:hypothetical protein